MNKFKCIFLNDFLKNNNKLATRGCSHSANHNNNIFTSNLKLILLKIKLIKS